MFYWLIFPWPQNVQGRIRVRNLLASWIRIRKRRNTDPRIWIRKKYLHIHYTGQRGTRNLILGVSDFMHYRMKKFALVSATTVRKYLWHPPSKKRLNISNSLFS